MSAAAWTAKITAAWQSTQSTTTIEGYFETGRLLMAAKRELPHGEFLKMIKNDLPFDQRYAQLLMSVAGHPRLTDAKCISHLPPHIGALYELSRLDGKSFDK